MFTRLMASVTLPIVFRNNHLYVRIDGALWVYDTGADTSFGNQATSLLGPKEPVPELYAGQFSAADISGFLGETVAGETWGHTRVHVDLEAAETHEMALPLYVPVVSAARAITRVEWPEPTSTSRAGARSRRSRGARPRQLQW